MRLFATRLTAIAATLRRAWSPTSLFAASEQGVWYDPSDMSTMYQDAAGTTPVYMPGQGQVDPPIGIVLDRRKGFQNSTVLIPNGDFSAGTSGWSGVTTASLAVVSGALQVTCTGSGYGRAAAQTPFFVQAGLLYLKCTITAGAAIALGDGVLYNKYGTYPSTASGTFYGFVVPPGNITLTLLANSNVAGVVRSFGAITAYEIVGTHAYQTTTTSRPTLSARYNQLTGTESLATQSVAVAATTYTLTTAGPGSVTLSGAASGTYTAGSRIITCTAGTLTLTVSGSVTQADLRVSNDGIGLPPYQRVVDANTYDTTGFPLYLKFDGVDDWLQTAAVDCSGTDKITLAFAARKHADATAGELLGFSATPSLSAGGFGVLAPPSATPRVEVSVCGATNGYAHVSSTAPETGVYVAGLNLSIAEVANGKVSVRKNGAAVIPLQIGPGTGTGNFGSYPFYIGRRGGTSLPFNGRLYGLLIRGAATPDTTIAKVERYLNQKAKVF